MPAVPSNDGIENSSFSPHFDRRFVETSAANTVERDGEGRVLAWLKVAHELPPTGHDDHPFLHQCWLAYLSDDLATDTVRAAHDQHRTDGGEPRFTGVSLDHTIWFHRPLLADRWHLHDFSCHHFIGGRGLAVGHVFTQGGEHAATVAQEVLLRPPRG
jgi:acyl-CoA thioesterase-2